MRYISHHFISEDKNQLIFLFDFLRCGENVHDNKEFSRGNPNQ